MSNAGKIVFDMILVYINEIRMSYSTITTAFSFETDCCSLKCFFLGNADDFIRRFYCLINFMLNSGRMKEVMCILLMQANSQTRQFAIRSRSQFASNSTIYMFNVFGK